VEQFLLAAGVSVSRDDAGNMLLDTDSYSRLHPQSLIVLRHFIDVADGGNVTFASGTGSGAGTGTGSTPLALALELPAVFDVYRDQSSARYNVDSADCGSSGTDPETSLQQVTNYIQRLSSHPDSDPSTQGQHTNESGGNEANSSPPYPTDSSARLYEDASDVVVADLKVSFVDVAVTANTAVNDSRASADTDQSDDCIPRFVDSVESYSGPIFNPTSTSSDTSTALNAHSNDKNRRNLYNLLLNLGRYFETSCPDCPDLNNASTCYISALLLFDEDKFLHQKLAWLSQQL